MCPIATCSGRKKEIIDDEKSEMFRSQQEMLRRRREGKQLDGVSERRAKAKEAVRSCSRSWFHRHNSVTLPVWDAASVVR